jgi:hypothetical protein
LYTVNDATIFRHTAETPAMILIIIMGSFGALSSSRKPVIEAIIIAGISTNLSIFQCSIAINFSLPLLRF